MPRTPRVNLEGALYYVTSRAAQGQNLFNDPEDYAAYLELLAKYKNQHGFKLFAYSLVSAHVHLLVESTPQTSLSDIMHNITSAYTKFYNRKYKRQGHLFRGRYRATIIEKEPSLLRLTRYVHKNPVKLGLAAAASAYPYSSIRYYMGQDIPAEAMIPMKNDVAEAMSFLNGARYEAFLEADTQEEDKAFHESLHRSLYLGSQEFGQRVKDSIEQSQEKSEEEDVPEVPVRRRLVVPVVSGLVFAALASSTLLYTYMKQQKKQEKASEVMAPAVPEEAQIPFEIVGLDNSLWQVKFVAGTPFQTVDILTFKDKKMASENLNLNGYPASNYSMTRENNRVVWETMQTSPAGTASWRGEVEAGQMRGILSLRQGEKEPQDFSFVSLKYKKI
jgi:putative transposase